MWNILTANSIMKLEDGENTRNNTELNDNNSASPLLSWPLNGINLKLTQAAASLAAAASISSNNSVLRSVQMKKGVPQTTPPTRWTAPVHLDVGGTLYTTTLITLTKYPDSKLAHLFNGTLPITLDELKQHYFLDRDGHLFRHILNFLRCSKVAFSPSESFAELDQLIEEASFYQLHELMDQLLQIRRRNSLSSASTNRIITRKRSRFHLHAETLNAHDSDTNSTNEKSAQTMSTSSYPQYVIMLTVINDKSSYISCANILVRLILPEIDSVSSEYNNNGQHHHDSMSCPSSSQHLIQYDITKFYPNFMHIVHNILNNQHYPMTLCSSSSYIKQTPNHHNCPPKHCDKYCDMVFTNCQG